MDALFEELLKLVADVIWLYIIIVIIGIVLSWLVQFNVVNTSNRFVYMVGNFCYRLSEPALQPIRRYLPNFGNIDLSPVVLILGLSLVRNVLLRWAYGV